jgi:hypothetical protein
MNDARRLRIANRIHLLLRRELGQGIDVRRMLAEPLYARDVLLVCDAHPPGSDLDSLARHFRHCSAEPVDEFGQPSGFGDSGTGFGASRLPPDPDDPPLPRPAPRRWFAFLR